MAKRIALALLFCTTTASAQEPLVFPPIPHDTALYLRTMSASGLIVTKRPCPTKDLQDTVERDVMGVLAKGVTINVEGDKMWAAVGVKSGQVFDLDKDKHAAHRIKTGDPIIGYWSTGKTSVVNSRTVEVRVYRQWVGHDRDLVRIDISVVVQPAAGDDTCSATWVGTSWPAK